MKIFLQKVEEFWKGGKPIRQRDTEVGHTHRAQRGTAGGLPLPLPHTGSSMEDEVAAPRGDPPDEGVDEDEDGGSLDAVDALARLARIPGQHPRVAGVLAATAAQLQEVPTGHTNATYLVPKP